jgi:DNA-binding MarR family transcriptional regulator
VTATIPAPAPASPPERELPKAELPDRELIARIIAQVEASLRHLRCAASERLIREGVSMTHLHVLWLFEEYGELGMTRLADLLDVSLSNATGLVDRMEERGLVERLRVTDDRRVVHVRPTARGVELGRTLELLRSDLMEAVLEQLDERQLSRVAQAVDDIRSIILAEPVEAATDARSPIRPPGSPETTTTSDKETRP